MTKPDSDAMSPDELIAWLDMLAQQQYSPAGESGADADGEWAGPADEPADDEGPPTAKDTFPLTLLDGIAGEFESVWQGADDAPPGDLNDADALPGGEDALQWLRSLGAMGADDVGDAPPDDFKDLHDADGLSGLDDWGAFEAAAMPDPNDRWAYAFLMQARSAELEAWYAARLRQVYPGVRQPAQSLQAVLHSYEALRRADADLERVIDSLQTLLQQEDHQRNPVIYRALGDALMRCGRLGEALDVYRRALRLL